MIDQKKILNLTCFSLFRDEVEKKLFSILRRNDFVLRANRLSVRAKRLRANRTSGETTCFLMHQCALQTQILIVICCIHLHIHHTSGIPFLILSFLDFVAFVVRTLIFRLNQRKCAIFSTNVDILPLLFKQAIIAPNKLIGSQHYKRL